MPHRKECAMNMARRGLNEKIHMERYFFMLETFHYKLYSKLALSESNSKLRMLLQEMAGGEERHASAWKDALSEHGVIEPRQQALMGLRIALFQALRTVFGAALVIKLLEKDESRSLAGYISSASRLRFSDKEKKLISWIIRQEQLHESELISEMNAYESEVNYIRSVVFGLNDGLVEVLAAVAGLAVIATSPIVVVIGGMIIGVSGTLSMAGGAYLSSKSGTLVEGRKAGIGNATKPSREALYTGLYYFLGAMVAIAPFAAGVTGIAGIALAIVLVVAALSAASVVIAITSDTSIKRRMAEMITISLAASFATILLGLVMRIYFGVTI